MSTAPFLDTVRLTIDKHRMLRPGQRVLVGVSGGPDSLALLTALVSLREKYRITLMAACVDHGLRSASRQEAELVRKVGRMWGVPVAILRRKIRKAGGESLEENARRQRYEALIDLAKAKRCGAIALGHTQDDQAETVLMWLLRGTGTTGLAGIPPVREVQLVTLRSFDRLRTQGERTRLRIIRPLLECSRTQVESFLKSHGLRPCRDASNRSLRFLRNRIRHRLIPMLEKEFNPQLRAHLACLAEILREDVNWMEAQTTQRFRQVARVGRTGVRLKSGEIRLLPPALRRQLLRKAVERLQGDCQGFAAEHWLSLDQFLCNGHKKGMDFPRDVRAQWRRGQLFLSIPRRSGTLKVCRP